MSKNTVVRSGKRSTHPLATRGTRGARVEAILDGQLYLFWFDDGDKPVLGDGKRVYKTGRRAKRKVRKEGDR